MVESELQDRLRRIERRLLVIELLLGAGILVLAIAACGVEKLARVGYVVPVVLVPGWLA